MEETEKKLAELSFGKDASDKIEKFKNGLEKIENNYSEYFTNRKAPNDFEKNDRLHNHYVTVTDKNGISFVFLEESDLDTKIVEECKQLFKNIFNN
jgi:hypothetical protein